MLMYLNFLLYNCIKIISKIKSRLEFKNKNKLLFYIIYLLYKKKRGITLMIADVFRKLITT